MTDMIFGELRKEEDEITERQKSICQFYREMAGYSYGPEDAEEAAEWWPDCGSMGF